jgi:hypothetical protein
MRFEREAHSVGIVRDDAQIGARRLIRFAATLLPIAQHSKRNVVSVGELLLRQPERAAQCAYARYA